MNQYDIHTDEVTIKVNRCNTHSDDEFIKKTKEAADIFDDITELSQPDIAQLKKAEDENALFKRHCRHHKDQCIMKTIALENSSGIQNYCACINAVRTFSFCDGGCRQTAVFIGYEVTIDYRAAGCTRVKRRFAQQSTLVYLPQPAVTHVIPMFVSTHLCETCSHDAIFKAELRLFYG